MRTPHTVPDLYTSPRQHPALEDLFLPPLKRGMLPLLLFAHSKECFEHSETSVILLNIGLRVLNLTTA